MLLQNSFRQNSAILSTLIRSVVVHRNHSTNSINSEKLKGKYDIIIAGGGMVGCTLACSLGKNSLFTDLKILLLEGSPIKSFEYTSKFSNRVVALNQNTKALMNSLNIWRHVEYKRLQPVRHMQVWDACSDALITFSSSEIMDEDVAYIVENDVILDAINTELTSSEVNNVNIIYGAKIGGYDLPKASDVNTESLVKMSNGDTYSCKLLIGADGAKSAVRSAMGVQNLAWDYDQMGVVATLQLSEETDNKTAWQRFLPSGPIALLPLNSEHSSLVWSTSTSHAKQLLAMSQEQFVDAINDALWKQYPRSGLVDSGMSWLGSGLRQLGLADGVARQLPPSVRAAEPHSRAAFPLGFGHATRYVAPGVAILGDAAHRVHPLAGQGVNLGFGDAKHLTEFLADAVYQGLDIGHHSWLEKYETERQRHNIPTQIAIEAIHRLYNVDFPPFVLVRSLGLQITNALLPVKKLIMSQAVAT